MRPLLIALAVLAADQITKWLVLTSPPMGNVGSLFGVVSLDLVFHKNFGITFGLLSQNALSQPLMGGFTALIGVAILVWAIRLPPTDNQRSNQPDKIGLAMVSGGALGNSMDRLNLTGLNNGGGVIDFLDVYLTTNHTTYHWPTFNLADSAIVIGVGLLLFVSRPPKTPKTK